MGEYICHQYIREGFNLENVYEEHIPLKTRNTNNPVKKWAKDLNRHFSKDYIQLARRYMKRSSTSLTIREMRIKT